MRKIEQDMLKALRDRRDWQSGNTRVTFSEAQSLGVGAVYLHGSPIALVMSDGSLRAVRDTFERWTTSTTASRLRALGFGASIRGGEPHLDRTQITARNQED